MHLYLSSLSIFPSLLSSPPYLLSSSIYSRSSHSSILSPSGWFLASSSLTTSHHALIFLISSRQSRRVNGHFQLQAQRVKLWRGAFPAHTVRISARNSFLDGLTWTKEWAQRFSVPGLMAERRRSFFTETRPELWTLSAFSCNQAFLESKSIAREKFFLVAMFDHQVLLLLKWHYGPHLLTPEDKHMTCFSFYFKVEITFIQPSIFYHFSPNRGFKNLLVTNIHISLVS